MLYLIHYIVLTWMTGNIAIYLHTMMLMSMLVHFCTKKGKLKLTATILINVLVIPQENTLLLNCKI